MDAHQRPRLAAWAAHALRRGGLEAERLAARLQQNPNGHETGFPLPSRRIDHDPLTGCVVRESFTHAVGEALESARRDDGRVGIIAVEVDQFTALIASHGASAGDEVLAEVADRLRQAVRPDDLVSRVGGDGFAMLWHRSACEIGASQPRQTILEVAHRLARRFDTPIETATGPLRVGVTIGTAALSDRHAAATDAGTLMQQASTAVTTARARGRSQVVAFDLSMEQQAVQKYQTENDLRTALHNDDVDVHYQPIVNLHDGAVVGVEALARWQHEAIGPISPGLFIPVAEESGLISELGAHVMEATVRQGATWNRSLPTDTLVTMNLSGRQLLDRNLVHTVRSILDQHSLDPALLCLEITESVVMNDVATSMTILGMLKDLGLCLAVDDFGTGYSSLSYLRRLPVDILKIDRSFVGSIYNRDDRMIVKAIIDLAHTLGMTTVAEGIETRMQVEVLHALDCDMAQGFLLHPPTTAEEVDMTPIDFSNQPEAFVAPTQDHSIYI